MSYDLSPSSLQPSNQQRKSDPSRIHCVIYEPRQENFKLRVVICSTLDLNLSWNFNAMDVLVNRLPTLVEYEQNWQYQYSQKSHIRIRCWKWFSYSNILFYRNILELFDSLHFVNQANFVVNILMQGKLYTQVSQDGNVSACQLRLGCSYIQCSFFYVFVVLVPI